MRHSHSAAAWPKPICRQTRGIGDWLDTFAFLDQVFRFHPDCPFGGERLPCMLALVRDIKTDNPVAIHRTALTKDGHKIDRMSLGPVGGGAIKISPDFEVHSGLMIGEGIETVLSAVEALSVQAGVVADRCRQSLEISSSVWHRMRHDCSR